MITPESGVAPGPAAESERRPGSAESTNPQSGSAAQGPADWQQRLEESPLGRGVLSTLIVATLIAILAMNMPASHLRNELLKPGLPYLEALGLNQGWGVFAPDPRRFVVQVSATVDYADGKSATWNFPRNGALIGTYRDYRWRKWAEYLSGTANSILWRPAALWVASHGPRPGQTVTRVTLMGRFLPLLPPGASANTGPAGHRVIYTLRVLRGGAKR